MIAIWALWFLFSSYSFIHALEVLSGQMWFMTIKWHWKICYGKYSIVFLVLNVWCMIYSLRTINKIGPIFPTSSSNLPFVTAKIFTSDFCSLIMKLRLRIDLTYIIYLTNISSFVNKFYSSCLHLAIGGLLWKTWLS